MFVVKHVAAGESGNKDRARLLAAQEKNPLPERREVVAGMLEALAPAFALRPKLSKAVVACAEEWVGGEMSFVINQKGPSVALASFYEGCDKRVEEFIELVSSVLGGVLQSINDEDRGGGVVEVELPLIGLVRNPTGLVQALVETIVGLNFDGGKLRFGAGLASSVVARMCRLSGMSEEQARQRSNRIKWPKDLDLPPVELVTTFLRDTPLGTLLLSPVTVKISDAVRMEHCVITAGAGHGKTQTLQHLIACDLERPRGGEVGMVVIDSQGDLIGNIQRLKRFSGNNRLLLIDASDVEYPVALNIFDLGGASLDELSLRDREQALAAIVQLYEYVIGGLFGAEMTQKQSTVFRFLIRLMLSIDGATIHTLRECLEEPKNFIHHMERLNQTARHFFLNEFLDRQFGETRKQILRRLYGVLQNPAFERMFASRENRVDLYKALNEGRVVLCNTSREFLQDECRVFGRYCIAVALKAAFDRARIPSASRRTSFLYIDEASDYFDESVGQLLAQARKYKLGVVLAHQALDQMSDGLRAIVMANTSVKLAGGASVKDARFLSGELRTTPEFILAQEKQGNSTRFATFVRNTTPSAVSWRVPFLTLEQLPMMTKQEHAAMLERNRMEVSSGVREAPSEANDNSAFGGVDVSGDFSETY